MKFIVSSASLLKELQMLGGVINNTNTLPNNGTITISAGGGLSGGAAFTTNQSANETITVSHADTSTQASVNNTGRTYIQDVT